jgi:hypothetical protein
MNLITLSEILDAGCAAGTAYVHRVGGMGDDLVLAETAGLRSLLAVPHPHMTTRGVVRIPVEAGQRFRSKPATRSGGFRPPIPEQAGHRFR